MSRKTAKRSTNPFDDDLEDGIIEDNTSTLQRRKQQRLANLNFTNPFNDVEEDELAFDGEGHLWTTSTDDDGFFSVNEKGRGSVSSSNERLTTNDVDEDTDEMSPLRSAEEGLNNQQIRDYQSVSPRSGLSKRLRSSIPKEIQTGVEAGHLHHRYDSHQMRSRRSSTKKSSSVVMTELATGDNAVETMDYKYILLEDLGTASSWFILLLPYLAFCLSMFLEYATPLSVSTIGPIHATELCDVERIYEVMHRFPTTGTTSSTFAEKPCHASFSMTTSLDDNDDVTTWSGIAFDSGTLSSMPVIGTYLNGDVTFSKLSLEALAMVAQGRLKSSFEILEQTSLQPRSNDTQEKTWIWKPLVVSASSAVSMTCVRDSEDLKEMFFNCKTPDLLSMAFSMPETAIYSGGPFRFFVYYEQAGNNGSDDMKTATGSHVNTLRNATITTATTTAIQSNTETDEQLHSWVTIAKEIAVTNPSAVLEEIVSSSQYTMKYRSHATVLLDTFVRALSFAFSLGFLIFWCRKLGVQCCHCGRFLSCCFFGLNSQVQTTDEKYWWENPWVLFPERYYILLLLVSLLLVQEPFLVVIYFFPHLHSNTLHMVADAAIGIGVQGILMVYLCLFEGLKYHTADRSKRRAERQRQALQLRRAVKFVNQGSRQQNLSSPDAADDFYKEFGDVDGSTFTSHLRLPSDPLADGWADFLLPKLFLWLVGVSCVIVSAYFRFSPGHVTRGNALSSEAFSGFKKIDVIYVISSMIQVTTIVVWICLIVVAVGVTGEALKREPFLGTRPAQLSYRVLFAHTALAITALLISFLLYVGHLQSDWHGPATEVSFEQGDKSFTGLTLGAIQRVITQFPYSGLAATVGFGRLLCVTVEVLITAFIFLPTHTMDTDDDNDEDNVHPVTEIKNYRKKKREKRLVVHMAKESKTWRIFPCPIQYLDSLASPLQDNTYQIFKDLHTDRITHGRGLVSIGSYTPVFCNEVACWLNEASWQAYYTPRGSSHMVAKDGFIGWMNLEAIGLRLEGYVHDERTNAQAFIATNVAPQVDGEEDSIVVVAFRGTSNVAHMQIDLRMRQVPLLEQIAGVGDSPICIFPDRVNIDDKEGWIWNTHTESNDGEEHVQCVACWTDQTPPYIPFCHSPTNEGKLSSSAFEAAVAQGAKDILKITPIARNTFPLVHEGFQDAYVQIRKQIFDLLIPVLQRQMAKALEPSNKSALSTEPLALPKIYCTGHSLGGSLAQIFALDLASNCNFVLETSEPTTPPANQSTEPGEAFFAPISPSGKADQTTKVIHLQPPIGVYTFGQPRVGNRAFSKRYKQQVPHTFRVVNEGDAITAVPNYLCCGGIYKHAGLEVVLDQGMTGNILVGPTVVETLFRFHKVRTSVGAHQLARYRDCLECAFDSAQLLDYYRGHNVAYQELAKGKSTGKYGDSGGGKASRLSSTKKSDVSHIPEWMIAPRNAA